MNGILILTVVLFLTSCNYNQSKKNDAAGGGGNAPQKILSPDEITFKIVNEAVIQPACLSCHSDAAGNKGGLNLEGYAKVFAEKNAIKDLVAKKEMPPATRGPIDDRQIKMIIDWIEAGAHENGKLAGGEPPAPPAQPPTEPQPPVTPPPVIEPPVTEPPVVVQPPTQPPVQPPPVEPPVVPPAQEKIYFAQVFEKVIKTNCFNCHAAPANRGGVNLETYANVFASRHEIKFEVENGTMPTKRGTPLTDEQKKMIISWIEQGAPEKPL